MYIYKSAYKNLYRKACIKFCPYRKIEPIKYVAEYYFSNLIINLLYYSQISLLIMIINFNYDDKSS
jgi:hypothetical protein